MAAGAGRHLRDETAISFGRGDQRGKPRPLARISLDHQPRLGGQLCQTLAQGTVPADRVAESFPAMGRFVGRKHHPEKQAHAQLARFLNMGQIPFDRCVAHGSIRAGQLAPLLGQIHRADAEPRITHLPGLGGGNRADIQQFKSVVNRKLHHHGQRLLPGGTAATKPDGERSGARARHGGPLNLGGHYIHAVHECNTVS